MIRSPNEYDEAEFVYVEAEACKTHWNSSPIKGKRLFQQIDDHNKNTEAAVSWYTTRGRGEKGRRRHCGKDGGRRIGRVKKQKNIKVLSSCKRMYIQRTMETRLWMDDWRTASVAKADGKYEMANGYRIISYARNKEPGKWQRQREEKKRASSQVNKTGSSCHLSITVWHYTSIIQIPTASIVLQ